MTQIRSEAEHLESCPQTDGSQAAARSGPAECDWLVDRVAGMNVTWSEHLAWLDDTDFSKLMRRLENTGRPLGDEEFVKEIGR